MLLLLMVVKCLDIFFKNFKATENWVVAFVSISLGTTINKKELGD